MGRHAASNDSTVSPPRSNPRALRDLHPSSPSLDAAPLDAFPSAPARMSGAPIDAADLIARFRESGLLSEVSHRATEPFVARPVNATAPLALHKRPVLDRTVALKPAAPTLTPYTRLADPADDSTDNAANEAANNRTNNRTNNRSNNPASGPSVPVRVADLLNRHPDIASRSPRTGHRAGPAGSTGSSGRTLSALRPLPSIRVAVRPMLTVAAIVTAFALAEAPNLLTISHATPDPRVIQAQTTRPTEVGGTSAGAAVGTVTTAADLPTHRPTIAPGTSLVPGTSSTGTSGTNASSGRVSRSTRRALGAPAHQVPALKPGQTVPGTWIRPSSGRYTSCFCSRWGSFHAGIDLAGKLGTPILAVGDGTVLKAGPASGFGNWVVIEHSNGDVSIYGHMQYFFVHAGQKVKAGEKIAVVGDQGFSTGPHLHFEVHKGGLSGTKINPIPWLKARGIVIGPQSKDG